jgi:hypothetical protein
MTTLAAPAPARVTREQYFALVDPEDHVELLEGVIVAMRRRDRVTRGWWSALRRRCARHSVRAREYRVASWDAVPAALTEQAGSRPLDVDQGLLS